MELQRRDEIDPSVNVTKVERIYGIRYGVNLSRVIQWVISRQAANSGRFNDYPFKE